MKLFKRKKLEIEYKTCSILVEQDREVQETVQVLFEFALNLDSTIIKPSETNIELIKRCTHKENHLKNM